MSLKISDKLQWETAMKSFLVELQAASLWQSHFANRVVGLLPVNTQKKYSTTYDRADFSESIWKPAYIYLAINCWQVTGKTQLL